MSLLHFSGDLPGPKEGIYDQDWGAKKDRGGLPKF